MTTHHRGLILQGGFRLDQERHPLTFVQSRNAWIRRAPCDRVDPI